MKSRQVVEGTWNYVKHKMKNRKKNKMMPENWL